MEKYSNDLELKVVQYYSNNYISFKVVADKFNISSWTTVRNPLLFISVTFSSPFLQ